MAHRNMGLFKLVSMSTIPEYKISALQQDSTEFDFAQEINLSVENVFSSTNLYGKQNLQDILEYIRVNSSPGFGVKKILASETLLIPIDREMIVSQYIDVEGNLDIEGELTIL